MKNHLQPILKELPPQSGVYLFKDKKGKILYVGKARNLKQRVSSYFLPSLQLGPKTESLMRKVENVAFRVVEAEFEALLLEAALIGEFQPKYNLRLKDDKSFLYIKITPEDFPRIYAARKVTGGYGPFPKARVVRQILKFLRQIFPYRSCRHLPKKACLYFDLGLCPAPCLGMVSKKNYGRQMTKIKGLLEGKRQKLARELTREMENFAKKNEFEKAAALRDQIFKIEELVKSRPTVTEYWENPNLVEDLREEEMRNLTGELEPYLGPFLPLLKHLEAFDVSNIAGKMATGAMVVFQEGEPEKSLYRRFKIKLEGKPNDVAMLKEILRRRFRHPEWEEPDLIIIDGGKGQVKGAQEVLKTLKLKVPVIGLTKRWETLIIPLKEGFVSLNLPGDSPALNLLKRIRDEAHRFALAYHQKLRTNF